MPLFLSLLVQGLLVYNNVVNFFYFHRNCIGQEFAMNEQLVLLSHVLRNESLMDHIEQDPFFETRHFFTFACLYVQIILYKTTCCDMFS